MFQFVTRTWNPIKGCLHNCVYCWARRLAETKLKSTRKYRDGFLPRFFPHELNVRFKPNEFVFVADMGDMFGKWVPDSWIKSVINVTKRFPKTTFLFLTKNPARYQDFVDLFGDNCILGATIETNRNYNVTKAPPPAKRYKAMKEIDFDRKFVSIEPVMDFDYITFYEWIRDIGPEMVAIGYDNYNNGLPEPPVSKVRRFISDLEKFTKVWVKTIKEDGK